MPPTRPSDKELVETPSDSKLYIERRDWVRIRVEEEHWDDASPVGIRQPALPPPPPGAGGEAGLAKPTLTNGVAGRAPYSLVVSAGSMMLRRCCLAATAAEVARRPESCLYAGKNAC